jgi:hypothetical protein
VVELAVPPARWVASYVLSGFIALAGLVILGLAIPAAQGMGLGTAAMIAAFGMLILSTAAYTFRDGRAKRLHRMRATPQGLELHLPAARSLTHHLAALTRTVAWSEVAAIETRLEAYSSLGMANMQRAYGLKLRDGEVIVLGEDRALGSGIATGWLGTFVAQVAEHYPVQILDRGMAEGHGGFLSVLFTAPPPWSAENLDQAVQAKLWKRAGRTGMLAVLAPLVLLVVALLADC